MVRPLAYVDEVSRPWLLLLKQHGLDVLIVLTAVAAAVGTAVRDDADRPDGAFTVVFEVADNRDPVLLARLQRDIRADRMPPRSGLIVIAERRMTLRVAGTTASSHTASQARATSMLKRHVSGTFGSDPPRMPVVSSLPASWRWA